MSTIVPPNYSQRKAAPLDGFIDQADKILGGISLELKPPDFSAMTADDKRVAQAAAIVAATPAGLTLLEYLADQTLRRPTFFAHQNLDPMRGYALGCQREGQNQLFVTILAMIQRGRAEKTETRPGADT